jgi:hypothetical protein
MNEEIAQWKIINFSVKMYVINFGKNLGFSGKMRQENIMGKIIFSIC